LIVLLLALGPAPTFSAVHQVQSIGLTVSNLEQEARFFTQVLPFEQVSYSDSDTQESAQLLGLSRAKLKVATLKLGSERITLTQHLDGDSQSRLIPAATIAGFNTLPLSYEIWTRLTAT
jgi:hypothetical protein